MAKRKKNKKRKGFNAQKTSRLKGAMRSLFASPESRRQYHERKTRDPKAFARVQRLGFDDGAHIPGSDISYATKKLRRA